jgi:hypothetical protein
MNEHGKPEKTPDNYVLNTVQDLPDIRDWPYEPTLATLKRTLAPPDDLTILDQKNEGSCTGFGLAATINLLNRKRSSNIHVSPRMLYEMAKRHDEWPGEAYAGSSCRGAIKGWYNMGVCTNSLWKYEPGNPGHLTVERAKAARKNTIGAYYRLETRISDFHAALNETGVVYCSAKTHKGWFHPDKKTGVISFVKERQGGHAFSIVGYNTKGFWIQNSWSERWGKHGLGLWLYEDWFANVMDAWVVSLALPTPQIWHLPEVEGRNRSGAAKITAPPRSEIAGHFVHLDDGRFHTQGHYWSDLDDVRVTAENLALSGKKYDHLLLYAHGGLNSPIASAGRIAAMKETFKKNRIYPYHFMYDTGLVEELKDVIFRREEPVSRRVEGVSDLTDKLVEIATRIPGRALWREMKDGAGKPFKAGGDGLLSVQAFTEILTGKDRPKLQVHVAGHSTGGILLARLLKALARQDLSIRIASCSLLAPACTVKLFKRNYLPLLEVKKKEFGVDFMQLFNLKDNLEQEDQVAQVYRKSLLYLVSRAFEEKIPEKILGMERYCAAVQDSARVRRLGKRFVVHYSDGRPGGATASTSHGGFDNDPETMNCVLRTILGKEPEFPFTAQSLAC